MRRLIVLSILLFASVAFAAKYSETSGEKTADVAVTSSTAYITAVQVITDGTNDAKLIVYDNTAASGTVVTEISVVGADNYGGRVWVRPVKCSNGIYGDITGTGASFIIEFTRTAE